MDPLSTNYFPTPSQISPTDIANARDRLATYLATWWPELDARPGSVFGDLDLTPRAVLTAAGEIAWLKFKSDCLLANIAQGIIYDTDFVTSYLQNFGVSAQDAITSTGVIQIQFSSNQSYVIDPNSSFTFGTSVYQIAPTAGDPVIVYPVGSTTGEWVLTQISPGVFAVYLPVVGPAGGVVKNGDVPVYTLTQQTILSITAAGDFDPGSPQETLPQLAVRAQQIFASATLTSRSGVISFVNQNWPNITGVSAVITGDNEMLRASQNPLGIAEGAVDIFLRSNPAFTAGQIVATLTYSSTLGGWVGGLSLPSVPAFFDVSQGVFQVANFDTGSGINTVYSSSVHPTIDNLGVAYSKYEQLGILIADLSPTDFQAASIGAVEETTGTGASLAVTGEYESNFFSTTQGRSINMRLAALTTINGQNALLANIQDSQSGDTGSVYFTANSSSTPTAAMIYTTDPGYLKFFNGLGLTLTMPGVVGFSLAALLGANFEFSFNGKTASFNINYQFDSLLVQADSVVQDTDNAPVQTSVFIKSFVPCYVDKFVVNYRIRRGNSFDSETAQQQIFAYVNSLTYPDVYDDSAIGAIVTANGGSSLLSVTKHGTFYPSLASQYVNQAGSITAVPTFATTTLLPPTNDYGFGPRNTGYILSLSNILFNSSIS